MQKIKLLIAVIGTIIMMFIMTTTGAPLKTSNTPMGILNLEFAHQQQQVEVILKAWEPKAQHNLIQVAKTNTYWDFLYLICYGFLLYYSCRILHEKLPNYGKIGLLFSRFAILAAVLDVVENGFMLGILNESYTALGLKIMVTASIIKWAIAVIVVLYCLVGLSLMAKRSILKF